MDDGTALLAAIALHPDEDVPRLAYADWLDEHNLPIRAEFIRVQCELARLQAEGDRGCNCAGQRDNPRHLCRQTTWVNRINDLQKRERQLWAMSQGWSHPWVGALEWFHRGFLRSVHSEAKAWLAHADAILAAHPVQDVTWTTLPDQSAIELSSPINTQPWPRIRWKGGREWVEVPAGYPSGPRTWLRTLAEAEWPGVKTWSLPRREYSYTTARLDLEAYQHAEFMDRN